MAANNHLGPKRRLEELLALAQTYQGCNRKQLARALRRDPSNLVPESGIPKVDLVIELANVLDWPVEDVVRALAGDCVPHVESNGHIPGVEPTFEGLDAAAREAHREGRYMDMVRFAKAAYRAARSGEERAKACNREAGGWDGIGRYRNALEALQRGLNESGATTDRRLLLRSNLANAYYTLWQLVEGKGVACDVILWFDARPPETHTARVARATARYVRGNCHRRLMDVEPERARDMAHLAREDLTVARQLFMELAETQGDDSYAGIANTCLGGVMEAEIVLGQRTAAEVLEAFAAALDPFVDPSTLPVGDWLESYGWWCIFGCNIALRHLSDERELQRSMAIFTNKADEIAEKLGNWSMRERVFTMEYARRQRFTEWTGVDSDWMIDGDDVRVIAGTMGRFPAFQPTGWRILRTAKFVRDNG